MEPGFKWAYKVVIGGSLGTWRSISTAGKLLVQYEIGKESVAPVGGLLCFAKYKQAQKFAHDGGFDTVLKVRAYEPVTLNLRQNFPSLRTLREMKMVWNPKSRKAKQIGRPWPEGTVAYRRIIPTKEVK